MLDRLDEMDDIDTKYNDKLSVVTGKDAHACKIFYIVCNNYVPISEDAIMMSALARCFMHDTTLWQRVVQENEKRCMETGKEEREYHARSVFDETLENVKFNYGGVKENPGQGNTAMGYDTHVSMSYLD